MEMVRFLQARPARRVVSGHSVVGGADPVVIVSLTLSLLCRCPLTLLLMWAGIGEGTAGLGSLQYDQ